MPTPNYSSVSDSTDWLQTRLQGLAIVEAALRCRVCKDFYKTPMMTTCAHTFCSLCIRRAFASDGKCPLCRAPDQELKLRPNIILEEIVDAFVEARSAVLEVARNTTQHAMKSPKRPLALGFPEDSGTVLSPERKRLRSSARLSMAKDGRTTTPSISPADLAQEDPRDGDYRDEPDDGLIPCPICGQRMKEWQVFSHLDACTGESSPGGTPAERATAPLPSVHFTRPLPNNADRLPALNYSMLKDHALRKKMSDLGISTHGPRSLLERRHKEWVTIWNANCDASKPKNRAELLNDLQLWERTQGGKAPALTRTAQHATTVRDKDFDAAAWAARHETSFKELIANARRSQQPVKTTEHWGKGKAGSNGPTSSTERGQVSSITGRSVPGSPNQPIHVTDDAPELGRNRDIDAESPARMAVNSTTSSHIPGTLESAVMEGAATPRRAPLA